MSQSLLEIRNLHAVIAEDGTEILKGVDLEVGAGQIHAIMGPNGSGKSTLAKVLSGHPAYEVTDGEVIFKGVDLLELEPDERAQSGLFLAFQYPIEIAGVSIANFLRTALKAKNGGQDIDIFDYQEQLIEKMEMLQMDRTFAERSVNDCVKPPSCTASVCTSITTPSCQGSGVRYSARVRTSTETMCDGFDTPAARSKAA